MQAARWAAYLTARLHIIHITNLFDTGVGGKMLTKLNMHLVVCVLRYKLLKLHILVNLSPQCYASYFPLLLTLLLYTGWMVIS